MVGYVLAGADPLVEWLSSIWMPLFVLMALLELSLLSVTMHVWFLELTKYEAISLVNVLNP